MGRLAPRTRQKQRGRKGWYGWYENCSNRKTLMKGLLCLAHEEADLRRFVRGHNTMDLKNVLAQLRDEREALDAAISNLERLEHNRHHGPGRPPSFVKSP